MTGETTDHGRRPAHDVVVLAGGGGTRLGGTDKAALVVAGRTLLDRVLDAAAGARRVVVVGPVDVPAGVLQAVEDPPRGGPVAGIVAGMTALARERPVRDQPVPWTLVLAVDQPDAASAVPALLEASAAAGPEAELLCHEDTEGHPQWLLAAYRTSALHRAVAAVGTGHGTSVRRLVGGLRTTAVTEGADHVGDIDTWADHRAWEDRLRDDAGGRTDPERGRLGPAS